MLLVLATANNQIVLESDDGTPGRMDFYCESSNAHYTRIQAAAHSSYSGNVTVTLPVVSGTVIVGGAVTNTTQISPQAVIFLLLTSIQHLISHLRIMFQLSTMRSI